LNNIIKEGVNSLFFIDIYDFSKKILPYKHRKKSNYLNIMKKLKIIFWVLSLATLLSSHPHVWIEYRINPVFSDVGLEGLQVEWSFDEMFSWEIMMDYTENQNCNISETENKIIEKEAFNYLSESNYFANFHLNGEKKTITIITDFQAEKKDDILIYHFFIPWKVEATSKMNNLEISFFDETIFCEIIPKKDGMTIIQNDNILIKSSMVNKITYNLNFIKVNNEVE
jgi:ABC-type uncharacterized transport system substrate-binding protein